MATAPHHDALFRHVFSRPEEAASLLRAYLPRAVAASIEWSSLTIEPGSFVDAALASRHTDLLCSCGLKGGGEASLYVLLEHQSTEDSLMAFRMARYLVRVLDAWLAARSEVAGLPIVVPLVLYNGARPWRGSTELRDLFTGADEVRAALGPAVPSLRFLLEDLTDEEEARLDRRALTAFAELTLRALARLPRSPDPASDARRWLGLLRAVLRAPDGLTRLGVFVAYVRSVAEVDDEALRRVFAELGPAAEEVVMTAAERLREEGRREGLEKGLERGLERGLEKGRRAQAASTLRSLLSARFGSVPEETVARLDDPAVALSTLELWTRRVLSAPTLDAVFEDAEDR